MDIVLILAVAAVVFGICFLVDKGFTKAFRNKQQYKSGLSVRFNRRFGSIGLVVAVLGLAAVFTGNADNLILLLGGCFLILVGLGLVVYYMSFGVYYDEEQFIVTTFGKKSSTYYYRNIQCQKLYNSYGNIIIELHLENGRSVQLHSGMEGVYAFLDYAFAAWLRQTGKDQADCAFYDPANSCWFPQMEE